jgi:hypothetical protein
MKRLAELNALRTDPIDLNMRIKGIASRSVHNAFHHEALAFARQSRDEALQTFLAERIKELNRIMQGNIVE